MAMNHEGYGYPPTQYQQRGQGYGLNGLALPPGAALVPTSSSNGRTSESGISDETSHTHTGLLSSRQNAKGNTARTPEYEYNNGNYSHQEQGQYTSYAQYNGGDTAYDAPLESPELLARKEQFMQSTSTGPNNSTHGHGNAHEKGYSNNSYSGGAGGVLAGAGGNVTSILRGYGTRHQLVFLIIVLLQTFATAAMIAITWAKIQAGTPTNFSQLSTNDEKSLRRRSITVYLAIFLFGSAFEIITALDALRLNNTIQLIGVVMFVVAMMIYGALLDGQVENALTLTDGYSANLYPSVRPYILAIPIIQAVAAALLAWYTYKLFKDFGWEILHLIGADRKLKKMYTAYLIHLCLLKFDFFFFVGFSMQYLILVLSVQEIEFIITIVAFPITVVFLILSAIAVHREIRWLSWIIFFSEVAALAYFGFKLYRLFDPSQAFRYQTSRKTLAVFSALAVVMLLCTVWTSVICYRNYGGGLRGVIPNYWSTNHKDAGRQIKIGRKNSMGAQGMLDNRINRMSID